MHTLDRETQLKPRLYIQGNEEYMGNPADDRNPEAETVDSEAIPGPLQSKKATILSGPLGPSQERATGTSDLYTELLTAVSTEGTSMPVEGEYPAPSQGMGQKRPALVRFQPLTLNDVPITRATVGGYSLDMDSIARVAKRYIPLPPVALPITFVDSRLNFYHNFFSALEKLLGQRAIDALATQGRYSSRDSNSLVPFVKQYSSEMHLKTDTQNDTFLKRIMSATFEIIPPDECLQNGTEFTVIANLYGFPYIEPGMRMKAAELGAWLCAAYAQYRIDWNNAFKSTGVPRFALEGVQDRYEDEMLDRPAITGTEMVVRERHRSALDNTDESNRDHRSRRTSDSRRQRSGLDKPKKSGTWPFGFT